MRMMMEMRTREAFEYSNLYNRALMQRMHSDLEDGPYRTLHDSDQISLYSWTGPFPEYDAEKGDIRRMMFASHDPAHAVTVAKNLCMEPELDIGDMAFHVNEAYRLDPAVVGDQGMLTTGTPILCRFGQDVAEEYGIDTKYEKTFWRVEHGTDLFWELLNRNIQSKYRLAFDEEPPEPPYFTGFTMERELAKPLVYDGNEVPHVAHEFSFEYEVQSGAHRKLLNLMLDAGLGQLNGTGFGFMNRAEDVSTMNNETATPAEIATSNVTGAAPMEEAEP